MDRHDTIGHDLVGMVVDDIVVCGAEPLFMTDYIACGRVVPERIADIVAGIDAGCALAGCALIGGETAEHPGLLGPDEYDVAGAATGMVRADAVLGPDRVRAGDVVVAMASSGLHSNGYSLARHVLLYGQRSSRWTRPRTSATPLGEVLLTPTRIYAQGLPVSLAAPSRCTRSPTSPAAGCTANLDARPARRPQPRIDRTTWTPAPIFDLIAAARQVAPEEMERTFNLGVGMVAVVPGARPQRSRRPPDRAAASTPGSAARSREPDALTATRRSSSRRHGSSVLVLVVVDSSSDDDVALIAEPLLPRSAASSCCRRSRSVPPLEYFSSRATFVCLALARPRPIGSTPSCAGPTRWRYGRVRFRQIRLSPDRLIQDNATAVSARAARPDEVPPICVHSTLGEPVGGDRRRHALGRGER